MQKVIKISMILMIFSLIFSINTKTAGAVGTDKFDVQIKVGFNDNYKIGYFTPVNITIKNKYKDINGEVEIQVPSTPGKYMSYVKPISLQKSAEKVITINVPVSMNRSKYAVNIYDGNNNVYKDTITIGMTSNNVTSFVGILSDDFASLSYINKVPASSGMSMLTKVIKLDENNFPEYIFTLNSFDVLVINDFETSRLNKMQYEALKQWVANGGTLLIGTGSKYNKTLSIFKDDFIVGTQGNVQEVVTSKIFEFGTNGDNKNETKLDALSLELKNSKVLMEDKNVKLVQTISKGKGIVSILAFDLGQAPFVNWTNNTAFAEKLLGIINPQMTSYKNNVDNIQNDFYTIRNSINQFSEMSTAKTTSFYLILFMYVIIVAPLSYFILKKFDKRELMWITVPAFAIIFGLIVYISGSGTRVTKITTNMISFLNIDEKGNTSAITYAGIFNANKMRIKVTAKDGSQIIPMADNINYGNPNNPSGNDVQEAKVFTNGGVEYKNSSLFETKVLQVQEKTKNIGSVVANLKIKNGVIIGTITNNTNLELTDCLVVTPDGYYKIDSLKFGQSVSLDKLTSISYNGNVHQMINDVFFTYSANVSRMNEKQRKELMDKRLEGSILQGIFNYGNGQINNFKFIAFSKTPIHDPLVINGVEVVKYERNVVNIPLTLDFTDGDTIEYPMGFVPYDVENVSGLNFDMMNKRVFGNGSAELVYNFGKDMEVSEIKIKNDTYQTKNVGFNFTYSIFNFEKDSYENIDKEKISGEDLKKYLSKENTLKLKFELKDSDAGIPQMSAIGRLR